MRNEKELVKTGILNIFEGNFKHQFIADFVY